MVGFVIHEDTFLRLYRKKGIKLFLKSKKIQAIKDILSLFKTIREMKNEIGSLSPTYSDKTIKTFHK